MAVDRSEIEKLAVLARIEMTDEAAEQVASSISDVLKLVDQLQAADTDGVALCKVVRRRSNVPVIMLTVPLAAAGGLFGLLMAGSSLNIYSQIGLIILIGVAAKNGILIVEFANQLRDQGRSIREAIIESSSLRLRPIIMTSIATAFGALPLVLWQGAGAGSRQTIGVVIFTGAIFATVLTLFVVPVIYGLLARFTKSPEWTARKIEEWEAQELREGGPKPIAEG